MKPSEKVLFISNWIKNYVDNMFCLTYGDGLSNINLKKLINQHKKCKKAATMTVVMPSARFGAVEVDKNKRIKKFVEKPKGDNQWVNGGFFVLNKKIMNYLSTDVNCDFEFGPLQDIANIGELKAFFHVGFWQCMDNVRERDYLNNLIKIKKAPWINRYKKINE